MGQPMTQKQIDELLERIMKLEGMPRPLPPVVPLDPWAPYHPYYYGYDRYPFGYPKVIYGHWNSY